MKKGLMGILAAGLMASAAHAGTLSLRFAGGGNEITMGPSQSATIEVVFAMASTDGAKNKLTGGDFRFDVGSLAADGVGQPYVADGSTKFMVTGVTAGAYANWNTAASNPVPAPFNRSYFLSAGDPNGLSGNVGSLTNEAAEVVATFTIHKEAFVAGDTYIVFRQEDPLPALYNGPAGWTNQWQLGPGAAQSFVMGQGNPGDGDPRWGAYHGYETFNPLIIHNVPEPSALALLGLGGLALLRRRK